MPGRVVILAHTSTSGPYWALLRQAVQVVDSRTGKRVRRDVETLAPIVPPTMLFVQRPESESGFSFARLKESTATSGLAGGTIAAGVAEASFEAGPSPTLFTAVHLVVVGGAVGAVVSV